MSRRKYERYLNPISRTSFSTAGTHRNQGRVGQTSLSRTLVRTTYLSRTNVPMGSGGCCGEDVIVNSCCKGSHSEGRSTINTKGHILSTVTNPTAVFNSSCEAPGSCNTQTVKNFDPAIHSNEMYLRRTKAKNLQYNWPKLDGTQGFKYECNSCEPGGNPVSHFIGGRKITNKPYAKRMAPMDSSEYLTTQYLYNNPTEDCCPQGEKNESGAIGVDDSIMTNDGSNKTGSRKYVAWKRITH